MENQNPEEEARVEQMIDELMRKAKIASQEYMKLDQETVDNITKAMSMAGLEHHMELAKMAVEETGRGIYEDKITKNMFATEYVYHSIKHEKTVGIIKENDEDGYVEIAEPVGIIAGVTPVTNPTSTTMFKSIIAAKTRNVIVFGFHPSAQKCSVAAATILRDAAVKAGAPENCILWVEEPSILATKLLMNHPDVSLILATGGTGMVKSAYSCGKPALGVGPGNVPCYIDKTAKLKTSVNDLVLSKSFDNGMICASEQSVIVDEAIYKEFEELMKNAGCYFVSPEEKEKLKFEREYLLSSKPMAIDVLIIKKKDAEPIHKNIGKIFRKYNIIEYKSPSDSLSVDDFYKVYGYTNFYKADTGKVNEIPIQELTITLVSKRYPRELIRHLKEVRHYTIDNPEEGIYYVIGDILPIQILVTNRLSPERNLWLYSLTDTLEDMSVTRQLLEDYKKNKENQLYQAVMEIIVKANENRLKEGKRDMCNALLELMKDELDEKREEGIKEGESLGENRINQLILKLSELNRTDEILKAAADREYQKKLLKEFGL